MKKIVLDTNVLLTNTNCIYEFGEDVEIIIPYIVLEELDNKKMQKVEVSYTARTVIKMLHGIILAGNPDAATPMTFNLSDYSKLAAKNSFLTFDLFSLNNPNHDIADNLIIQTAQRINGAILVTNDINMHIKATALSCEVMSYGTKSNIVKDDSILHAGHFNIDVALLSGEIPVVATLRDKNTDCYYFHQEDLDSILPEDICIGDYLHNSCDDFTYIYDGLYDIQQEGCEDIIVCHRLLAKKKNQLLNKKIYGNITPRNELQSYAIDSLLDPEVHLTVLLGAAGTGKTLLTMASAMELINSNNMYERVVFTKTADSQFEDIGFLPGTETEKVIAHCGAMIDALEFLHRDRQGRVKIIEDLLYDGVVEVKALNFIRGRSFANTVLIIDEFQNITPQQCKTILTRAGENCKVVILGNLAQIDNRSLTPANSGLTYLIDHFKDWDGCRIVQLEEIERSPLAEYAENNL